MNAAPADGVAAGGVALAESPLDPTRPAGAVRAETDGRRAIRLLVFTSLYPNAVQPRHGVFVEERLRHLIEAGGISATVVAPVPWFPFKHPRFGKYAVHARVPAREQRHGIDILHPRYPVIPKLGMNVAPSLMFRALLPLVRNLIADGTGFDLIDAHYFYPDGVAAVRMGAVLDKPVVVTARGNDVTLIPRSRLPRAQIRKAARRAAAVLTVSQALKAALARLGVDPEKMTVLRNGADLERFRPLDREAIRARLGLAGEVWLTVGHLIERKGVHIAIEALAQVPTATLLIAGDGPEESRLRRSIERLGIGGRIRFVGAVPHDELCEYYSAADVLVHAASREGMPNVVLESLACGTPVVAAPFAGVEEVLDAPPAGEIATARTADAIASAWLRLRERAPPRAATRIHAEGFGWKPVVEAQRALYARVLEQAQVATGGRT